MEQALAAEVQGAWVDGEAGMVYAKTGKIAKYIALILQVLQVGWASQKELQVIGGGMVYIAMFKRPLLCGPQPDLETDRPSGRATQVEASTIAKGGSIGVGQIPVAPPIGFHEPAIGRRRQGDR